MEKGRSAGSTGQILLAAYPDDRQREHAARWLGWIAYRLGSRASFCPRSISGWLARRWLGLVDLLWALPVLSCLVGAVYLGVKYLGDAPALVLAIIATLSFLAFLQKLLDRLPGVGRGPSTRPAGHALPVRWVRFGRLLADACDRGVLQQEGSAYSFADPATAAALAAPHHARDAERARRAADKAREQATLALRPGVRSALIAFLTESRRIRLGVDFGVGAVVLAFPFFPFYYNPPRTWLTILGQFLLLAIGIGAAAAVVAWPALPLLHRLSGWTLPKLRDMPRRWSKSARLAALVVAAAAAGAVLFFNLPRAQLDTPGPRWQIVGLSVVIAVWFGSVNALWYAAGVQALRLLVHGRLSTLVLVAGGAGALAFPVFPYVVHDRPDNWFFLVWVFAITLVELGTACGMVAWSALELLRRLSSWSLRNVRGLSRRGHLCALAAATATAVALIAAGRTVLAHAVVFTLPAACVAACGLWAGVLAAKKTHARMRGPRLLPDAIGAVTTAATLLALTERNLLTGVPATALLIAVAIFGSIMIWLTIKSSDRGFPGGGRARRAGSGKQA